MRKEPGGRFDHPDVLVAQDQEVAAGRRVAEQALVDVHVRAADAGLQHAHERFALRGPRVGHVAEVQAVAHAGPESGDGLHERLC